MERQVEIVNNSGGGDAGGRATETRAGSRVAKVAAETIGGSRGRAVGAIAMPHTQTTQRIGSGAGESGFAVDEMDAQAASRGDAGVGAHDPQLVRRPRELFRLAVSIFLDITRARDYRVLA